MSRFRRRWRNAALAAAALVAQTAHAGYGGMVITPPALNFGEQPAGTSSPPQAFTVDVNMPGSSISLNSVFISNPAYTRSGGTCPNSGSFTPPCTILLQFTPQEEGVENASFTVSAQVDGSPSSLERSITGIGSRNVDLGFAPGAVSVSQTSMAVGESIQLNIAPTTNGPSEVEDATVSVQVPKQMAIASPLGSNADWTCTGSSTLATCSFNGKGGRGRGFNFLPLPPITLNGLAPANPGNVVVTLSSPDFDSNPGDNTVLLPIVVLGGVVDLRPSFFNEFSIVPLGAEVQLAGTVNNIGNSASPGGTQVRFDPTPDLNFAGFVGSGWNCAPGSGVVLCDSTAPVPAGGVSTLLRVRFTAPNAPTQVSTLVEVLNLDDNLANNSQTISTRVANNDFSLTAAANPSSAIFPYTSQVQLTPQVVDGFAGGAEIRSTLPAGVRFLGSAGSSFWVCGSPDSNPVVCVLPLPGDVRGIPLGYPPLLVQLEKTAAGVSSVSFVLDGLSSIPDANPANNTATFSLNGESPVALRLSKTASVAQATVGQTLTFTLTAQNTGSVPATGLVLLDTVPQALEVLEAEGEGWSCSTAQNSVDCRRSELAAGSSASVLLRTRARAVGTHVNTANITATQVITPVNASAQVDIRAAGGVDLVLDKRATVSQLAAGQNFEYLLEVRNIGASEARDVVIEDVLPAGLILDRAELPGGQCSGTSTLRCTLGAPLAPAAQVTARIAMRAPNAPTTGCAEYTNTATVTTSSTDTDPASNTSSAQVAVCAPIGGGTLYDLSLEVSPATAVTGPRTFSMRVANSGANSYPGGMLEIDFGSTNLRLDSFASCTDGAQVARCMLPALASNQVVVLPLAVKLGSGTAAAGQIRLFAPPVDPGDANPANNSALITLTAAGNGGGGGDPAADLALSLSAASGEALAGSTTRFAAQMLNRGPSAASAAVLEFDLPAGLVAGNAVVTGGAASCLTSGRVVRCTSNADLAANASLSVELGVTLPAIAGVVEVRATGSSATTDPESGNNTAVASVRVRLENVSEATAVFAGCAGSDQIAGIAVDALARACADPNSPLQPLCRELLAAGPAACGQVREALTEIAPKDVLAQSLILKDFAATQFANVDARLSELRGGGGGFSLAGLNVVRGRQALSFGTLQALLRAAAGDADSEAPAYDPDLVSPWGFFANGTISSGDQDLNTERYRIKADFESRGITAGFDYRFRPNLVGGLALGYATFAADVSELSTLDTDALSLTAYGSWYPRERLYVDARFSIGRASFDLRRRIDFSVGGQSFNAVALGDTDADQYTFAASMGHHYQVGGWNITPNLGVRHVRSEVDGFTETGAGMFNVVYGEQSVDSTQVALGLQLGRVYSLSHGVLSPQFDLNLHHEFGSDERIVDARFVGDGSGGTFVLSETDPDQNYASAGLGFVYVTANGKQAYLNYRRLFGHSDLSRGTLNFGVRFEF